LDFSNWSFRFYKFNSYCFVHFLYDKGRGVKMLSFGIFGALLVGFAAFMAYLVWRSHKKQLEK